MRYINFTKYLDELPQLIQNHNETVVVYSDETCILQGENSFNYIEGVKIYKTHDFGGTIVNFEGDLCVGNYQYMVFDYGEKFMKKFTEFLVSKGLNATFTGNDILIDDKFKVASYMSQNIGGTIYTAIHISINMDLDLISKVCIKQINKIPTGLTEYGITTDMVKKWLEVELNG